MANHKSAEKSIRQTAKRTKINSSRMNRVRTFIRKVEDAIKGGDKSNANTVLSAAQSELFKAAKTGIISKNAAARKVSRLSARIKVIPRMSNGLS